MKKAYTLSEVLVVLLVLGIIAAFIIPAVMRTAPDRSWLLYKKSFYSMQEAASKMINNPDMYPVGYSDSGVEDAKKIYPKNDPTKGDFSDYSRQKFCENLANTFNVLRDKDEKTNHETPDCANPGSDANPNFYTTNGVAWYNFGGASDFGDMVEMRVVCAGTTYKIKVFKNGQVSTDSAWTEENKILKTPFKFRD